MVISLHKSDAKAEPLSPINGKFWDVNEFDIFTHYAIFTKASRMREQHNIEAIKRKNIMPNEGYFDNQDIEYFIPVRRDLAQVAASIAKDCRENGLAVPLREIREYVRAICATIDLTENGTNVATRVLGGEKTYDEPRKGLSIQAARKERRTQLASGIAVWVNEPSRQRLLRQISAIQASHKR